LSAPNTQAVTTETPATSTNGMTKKVLKGSLWVLVGQVLPLLATFIASPFVIRYLGTEAYGVLLIIASVPAYFSFSNFGMHVASTKFGAEAFGNNDGNKEAAIIRTAAFITLSTTLIAAIPLFIFAHSIIAFFFKVPLRYQAVATIGVRLVVLAMVFNVLSSVFNTPQLSRLKMGLTTLVNAVPRLLMTCLAPIVLYYGGGIEGAAWLACITALVILILNLVVSNRLLPGLLSFSIDKESIKPLLQFGIGMFLYDVAYMVIINMEKLLLPNITEDPKQAAYYSIAFTLAGLTNMYSLAIGQTLIPAFSQMLSPEKKMALNFLFGRSYKAVLVMLLPVCMLLLVLAKPFFAIWAGSDFAQYSTQPFYILMIGVFFSILSYIPYSILLAKGKTKLFARIFVIEIIPYLLISYSLINAWGIIGAAIAWAIKETVNAILYAYYAYTLVGIRFNLPINYTPLLLSAGVLAVPVFMATYFNHFFLLNLPIVMGALIIYAAITWQRQLTPYEREWVSQKIKAVVPTFSYKKNSQ
jgi:O-antigen/teichoic acid export membrane protein